MKDFRRNANNMIICEECGKTFKLVGSLARHIKQFHIITQKEYFDKWLKEEGEGECKLCGKETKFMNFSRYYQTTCSKLCNYKLLGIGMASTERRQKIKETCLKKYGVDSPLKSSIIRTKIEQENIKNYGVKNNYQRKDVKEKIKKTKKEKYGDEKYQNWDKQRQTCLERYGNECALLNIDIKKKTAETLKKRYGVEHQSQNENVHYKQMNSGKKIKYFRQTDLWYQGSYELDFLEKYYDMFEIHRANSIIYYLNGKKKYYHPDFYIPSLNLIIECKNSYYEKRDKEVLEAKEKATIANGFKYIMIVDKNYSEFDEFLSQGTSNL
jgi:hypothetical protein